MPKRGEIKPKDKYIYDDVLRNNSLSQRVKYIVDPSRNKHFAYWLNNANNLSLIKNKTYGNEGDTYKSSTEIAIVYLDQLAHELYKDDYTGNKQKNLGKKDLQFRNNPNKFYEDLYNDVVALNRNPQYYTYNDQKDLQKNKDIVNKGYTDYYNNHKEEIQSKFPKFTNIQIEEVMANNFLYQFLTHKNYGNKSSDEALRIIGSLDRNSKIAAHKNYRNRVHDAAENVPFWNKKPLSGPEKNKIGWNIVLGLAESFANNKQYKSDVDVYDERGWEENGNQAVLGSRARGYVNSNSFQSYAKAKLEKIPENAKEIEDRNRLKNILEETPYLNQKDLYTQSANPPSVNEDILNNDTISSPQNIQDTLSATQEQPVQNQSAEQSDQDEIQVPDISTGQYSTYSGLGSPNPEVGVLPFMSNGKYSNIPFAPTIGQNSQLDSTIVNPIVNQNDSALSNTNPKLPAPKPKNNIMDQLSVQKPDTLIGQMIDSSQNTPKAKVTQMQNTPYAKAKQKASQEAVINSNKQRLNELGVTNPLANNFAATAWSDEKKDWIHPQREFLEAHNLPYDDDLLRAKENSEQKYKRPYADVEIKNSKGATEIVKRPILDKNGNLARDENGVPYMFSLKYNPYDKIATSHRNNTHYNYIQGVNDNNYSYLDENEKEAEAFKQEMIDEFSMRIDNYLKLPENREILDIYDPANGVNHLDEYSEESQKRIYNQYAYILARVRSEREMLDDAIKKYYKKQHGIVTNDVYKKIGKYNTDILDDIDTVLSKPEYFGVNFDLKKTLKQAEVAHKYIEQDRFEDKELLLEFIKYYAKEIKSDKLERFYEEFKNNKDITYGKMMALLSSEFARHEIDINSAYKRYVTNKIAAENEALLQELSNGERDSSKVKENLSDKNETDNKQNSIKDKIDFIKDPDVLKTLSDTYYNVYIEHGAEGKYAWAEGLFDNLTNDEWLKLMKPLIKYANEDDTNELDFEKAKRAFNNNIEDYLDPYQPKEIKKEYKKATRKVGFQESWLTLRGGVPALFTSGVVEHAKTPEEIMSGVSNVGIWLNRVINNPKYKSYHEISQAKLDNMQAPYGHSISSIIAKNGYTYGAMGFQALTLLVEIIATAGIGAVVSGVGGATVEAFLSEATNIAAQNVAKKLFTETAEESVEAAAKSLVKKIGREEIQKIYSKEGLKGVQKRIIKEMGEDAAQRELTSDVLKVIDNESLKKASELLAEKSVARRKVSNRVLTEVSYAHNAINEAIPDAMEVRDEIKKEKDKALEKAKDEISKQISDAEERGDDVESLFSYDEAEYNDILEKMLTHKEEYIEKAKESYAKFYSSQIDNSQLVPPDQVKEEDYESMALRMIASNAVHNARINFEMRRVAPNIEATYEAQAIRAQNHATITEVAALWGTERFGGITAKFLDFNKTRKVLGINNIVNISKKNGTAAISKGKNAWKVVGSVLGSVGKEVGIENLQELYGQGYARNLYKNAGLSNAALATNGILGTGPLVDAANDYYYAFSKIFEHSDQALFDTDLKETFIQTTAGTIFNLMPNYKAFGRAITDRRDYLKYGKRPFRENENSFYKIIKGVLRYTPIHVGSIQEGLENYIEDRGYLDDALLDYGYYIEDPEVQNKILATARQGLFNEAKVKAAQMGDEMLFDSYRLGQDLSEMYFNVMFPKAHASKAAMKLYHTMAEIKQGTEDEKKVTYDSYIKEMYGENADPNNIPSMEEVLDDIEAYGKRMLKMHEDVKATIKEYIEKYGKDNDDVLQTQYVFNKLTAEYFDNVDETTYNELTAVLNNQKPTANKEADSEAHAKQQRIIDYIKHRIHNSASRIAPNKLFNKNIKLNNEITKKIYKEHFDDEGTFVGVAQKEIDSAKEKIKKTNEEISKTTDDVVKANLQETLDQQKQHLEELEALQDFAKTDDGKQVGKLLNDLMRIGDAKEVLEKEKEWITKRPESVKSVYDQLNKSRAEKFISRITNRRFKNIFNIEDALDVSQKDIYYALRRIDKRLHISDDKDGKVWFNFGFNNYFKAEEMRDFSNFIGRLLNPVNDKEIITQEEIDTFVDSINLSYKKQAKIKEVISNYVKFRNLYKNFCDDIKYKVGLVKALEFTDDSEMSKLLNDKLTNLFEYIAENKLGVIYVSKYDTPQFIRYLQEGLKDIMIDSINTDDYNPDIDLYRVFDFELNSDFGPLKYNLFYSRESFNQFIADYIKSLQDKADAPESELTPDNNPKPKPLDEMSNAEIVNDVNQTCELIFAVNDILRLISRRNALIEQQNKDMAKDSLKDDTDVKEDESKKDKDRQKEIKELDIKINKLFDDVVNKFGDLFFKHYKLIMSNNRLIDIVIKDKGFIKSLNNKLKDFNEKHKDNLYDPKKSDSKNKAFIIAAYNVRNTRLYNGVLGRIKEILLNIKLEKDYLNGIPFPEGHVYNDDFFNDNIKNNVDNEEFCYEKICDYILEAIKQTIPIYKMLDLNENRIKEIIGKFINSQNQSEFYVSLLAELNKVINDNVNLIYTQEKNAYDLNEITNPSSEPATEPEPEPEPNTDKNKNAANILGLNNDTKITDITDKSKLKELIRHLCEKGILPYNYNDYVSEEDELKDEEIAEVREILKENDIKTLEDIDNFSIENVKNVLTDCHDLEPVDEDDVFIVDSFNPRDIDKNIGIYAVPETQIDGSVNFSFYTVGLNKNGFKRIAHGIVITKDAYDQTKNTDRSQGQSESLSLIKILFKPKSSEIQCTVDHSSYQGVTREEFSSNVKKFALLNKGNTNAINMAKQEYIRREKYFNDLKNSDISTEENIFKTCNILALIYDLLFKAKYITLSQEESDMLKTYQNTLTDLDYEIVDMLGKPYHERMKVVANFVEDETLEPGKRIITSIRKPQINHKDKMVQSAEITVTQGPEKEDPENQVRQEPSILNAEPVQLELNFNDNGSEKPAESTENSVDDKDIGNDENKAPEGTKEPQKEPTEATPTDTNEVKEKSIEPDETNDNYNVYDRTKQVFKLKDFNIKTLRDTNIKSSITDDKYLYIRDLGTKYVIIELKDDIDKSKLNVIKNAVKNNEFTLENYKSKLDDIFNGKIRSKLTKEEFIDQINSNASELSSYVIYYYFNNPGISEVDNEPIGYLNKFIKRLFNDIDKETLGEYYKYLIEYINTSYKTKKTNDKFAGKFIYVPTFSIIDHHKLILDYKNLVTTDQLTIYIHNNNVIEYIKGLKVSITNQEAYTKILNDVFSENERNELPATYSDENKTKLLNKIYQKLIVTNANNSLDVWRLYSTDSYPSRLFSMEKRQELISKLINCTEDLINKGFTVIGSNASVAFNFKRYNKSNMYVFGNSEEKTKEQINSLNRYANEGFEVFNVKNKNGLYSVLDTGNGTIYKAPNEQAAQPIRQTQTQNPQAQQQQENNATEVKTQPQVLTQESAQNQTEQNSRISINPNFKGQNYIGRTAIEAKQLTKYTLECVGAYSNRSLFNIFANNEVPEHQRATAKILYDCGADYATQLANGSGEIDIVVVVDNETQSPMVFIVDAKESSAGVIQSKSAKTHQYITDIFKGHQVLDAMFVDLAYMEDTKNSIAGTKIKGYINEAISQQSRKTTDGKYSYVYLRKGHKSNFNLSDTTFATNQKEQDAKVIFNVDDDRCPFFVHENKIYVTVDNQPCLVSLCNNSTPNTKHRYNDYQRSEKTIQLRLPFFKKGTMININDGIIDFFRNYFVIRKQEQDGGKYLQASKEDLKKINEEILASAITDELNSFVLRQGKNGFLSYYRQLSILNLFKKYFNVNPKNIHITFNENDRTINIKFGDEELELKIDELKDNNKSQQITTEIKKLIDKGIDNDAILGLREIDKELLITTNLASTMLLAYSKAGLIKITALDDYRKPFIRNATISFDSEDNNTPNKDSVVKQEEEDMKEILSSDGSIPNEQSKPISGSNLRIPQSSKNVLSRQGVTRRRTIEQHNVSATNQEQQVQQTQQQQQQVQSQKDSIPNANGLGNTANTTLEEHKNCQ